MDTEEHSEWGLSQVGLKARSPEGHAAKAMHIKGDEYMWIEIQEKTFKNWVNEQLRPLGMSISNFQTDFNDGLKLIALIEVLQKRKLKKIKKPLNQHQCLENVQTALQAMASDNIKLVNIGNIDIVEGNLKLILGLMWSLILRYQIGRTNFPPKKLMVSWLQAVLHDLHITNFTSDWNSGIALSALLNYCNPRLCSHWKSLSFKNSVENCRTAMHIARDEFAIPLILTPEDLASPNLDELSGMTYLSYFMRDESPGYKATLSWVQKQLPQFNIKNFTSDWNDGLALCALVRAYGANVPDYKELRREKSSWEQNLQHGIIGGESLGVRPILKPKELSDPEVEHLGVMAYIASFQWINPRKQPKEKITISGVNLNTVHINKPAQFQVNILDSTLDENRVRAEVRYQNRKTNCQVSLTKNGGPGSFIPTELGMHELFVYYDNEVINGCPLLIKVHPDISKILCSGIDPCAFGSVVEVLINSKGVKQGNVFVEALAPSGKLRKCEVAQSDGVHAATFTPDEIGEWKIIVKHAGDHIDGSPFTCYVYDPSRVRVQGIGCTTKGKEKMIVVDASSSGWGEMKFDMLHNSVLEPLTIDQQGNGVYRVYFTPTSCGKYCFNVTFNSIHVKGSPFIFRVVENDKDLQGSEVDSNLQESLRGKKDRFGFAKDNHLSLESLNLGQSKLSEAHKYSKSSESLITTPEHGFSKPDYSANGMESKIISNGSSSHENLSFSQRAELVSSKLMAHNSDYKRSKAPAPPTPKKPLSPDLPFHISPSSSISDTRSFEKASKILKSKLTHENTEFSSSKTTLLESSHSPILENPKSFGSKLDPLSKKTKEGKGGAEGFVSKSDMAAFSSYASKYKRESFDVSEIALEGEGLNMVLVRQPTTFTMYAPWLKQDDIQATVTGPSGREVPIRLEYLSHGKYQIEYIPAEVGEHNIDISVAGKPLIGNPFHASTFDPAEIKVGKIPNGMVGKPVEFEINVSDAGIGNLEILVNGGHVTSNIKSLGSHSFLASFIPHTATVHTIEMKFNGHPVPGSSWKCEISEPGSDLSVTGENLKSFSIRHVASFEITAPGYRKEDIKVHIIGPSKVSIQSVITESFPGQFRVEFNAFEVGRYSIDVFADGRRIPGCPFVAKAYSASKIQLLDVSQTCTVGSTYQFQVDASQAGDGQLLVSVNDRKVPNQVQVLENRRCLVSFKPENPGLHIIEIKFNGENVPGCPVIVEAVDVNKSIDVSSQDLVPINRVARLNINMKDGREGDLKITLLSPSEVKIPVKLFSDPKLGFIGEFLPKEVGPHQVLVTLDDVPLPGSPFTCYVYDVSKVKVSKLPPGVIGKPCTFQVDASQAGEGTLELLVTTRKSSVKAEVSMRSRGLYDFTFIPQEKISHYVNISFNEEDLPGSPFKIEVSSSGSSKGQTIVASGEGLKQGLVGSLNVFEIETKELNDDIDVRITDPNGVAIPVSVLSTKHGTNRIEYQPFEIGTYKVEVLQHGTTISTKPFLVEICDPSRVKVVDVEDGIIGREQTFKVDVSRAGRGTINLSIAAASRDVKYDLKEINPGVYEVVYIPETDHPHKIDVYYNGHQSPGCPQIVEIRDPSHSIIAHGPGLKSCSCGETASFFIETGGFAEAKDFDIIVVSPRGSPLPVKCYQQKDGSLLAEWPTEEAGTHKIEILYAGKPINGSPFSCEVFDATKVQLQKIKTTTFAVGEEISFTLNRRNAGYAELDVTVTSPLGRHLPIEVKGTLDGEGELIEFTPTVSGKYKIAITYGGVEVPGSPVTFIAQESGIPKVDGTGLHVAQIGCPASFKIIAKGLWGQPHVTVDGPETEADSTIELTDEGVYTVTYIPLELGLFDIKILWNNKEVPGSPYHPRVVNTHKMRVIGGLENLVDEENHIPLTVGEEKRIPFDVADAGPCKPRAEVKGPSGIVPSKFEQTGNHRYQLLFTPQEKGEHQVHVYFADLALPISPLHAYAEEVGPLPDHTRVVLRGHGLTGAKVGEEAEFIIDGSEAGLGSPEVTISGVKADISVQILPIGTNVYKVVYTPSILGAYLLNVMWSDRQVKGCPLKVNVTAACDPQKVLCSGDGLRGGTVGKEIKAFIDTRKAGPGELTAHCMGPHKVAYCELYDHRDGTFTLYLKPQEGGRHVLTIKYGGEHVPGSPFTIRIAGAPDASKVRVYGPGIEPGVLATYQSRFICDTRGAGAGQLTVRIRGPKGAFRVEMQRESQKDRTILCKYDPTEPGDYRLEVKWSGEHVPGSPFMVMIFDTQEELNHYIQRQYQGQGNSPGQIPLADYFGGSLTYSTGFGQMSWKGSTAEL